MTAADNDLAARNVNWITLDEKGRVQIDLEALKANLEEDASVFADRADELKASFSRMPEIIEDEATNNKAADLVRLIGACVKQADAERTAVKDPFRKAGSLVDATYNRIIDSLDIPKGSGTKQLIERRMTLYQREVEALERRRREAIAAAERAEAERQRREAEEAAAKAQSEHDIDEAIVADVQAKQREADAVAAAKAAEAKPAELSRSRSDMGAVSSLRRFWDFQDVRRTDIDLEALRDHLPMLAIEQAIRSFIKAGGRNLRGASIFENTATSVR